MFQRAHISSAAALRVAAASAALVLLPLVFHLDGHAHASWLRFFGHFHPALLHIPIGLIVLVPILEIAGVRRAALRESAGFVVRLAVGFALATFVLGFMLGYGSGDTGSTLRRHLWGAVVLCIALMLCALVRPAWAAGWQPRIYPALLTVTLLALLWTGHHGGAITYGDDYLTRYMPAVLRPVLGLRSEANVPSNSFYAQRVHPVLDARCVTCHNASNVKGGLRLDTYDYLMRGGKDGAVVVAGKPERSLLLARVTLPSSDKHFMPAEGRTPLTSDEIKIMRAWITAGASASASAIPGFSSEVQAAEPPPQPVGDYSALMSEIVRMQQAQGAKLVPVSAKASDGLILQTIDTAPSFTDAQLAQLQNFAPYIVEAELGRTAITDGAFDTLRTFTHLRALHLEGTQITGIGLAKLESLHELSYLNLSGTKVTAQSVKPLKQMPRLQHVYLFNTPAQPEDTSVRNTQ